MANCPFCGSEIQDGTKECPYCNAQLAAPDMQAAVKQETEAVPQPVPEQPVFEQAAADVQGAFGQQPVNQDAFGQQPVNQGTYGQQPVYGQQPAYGQQPEHLFR